MKNLMKVGIMILATGALALAEDYSGKLIDANCSAAANPQSSSNSAAKNATESCAPTAQTKSFAVETSSGKVYKLDAEGNRKAEQLVKENPTVSNVTVSGSMESNGSMLKVQSINLR